MAPLLPRPGHRLLRCPVCRLDLTAAAGALACRNRHSFDLAGEGSVNLPRGGTRLSAAGGDTREQLQYRAMFLDAGHFDAIATTILEHLRTQGAASAFGPWHILDAGCGTAHHLAKIAEALSPGAVGLGLDLSKEAARHASRRRPTLAFAIADLWREWPVQGGVADLVLSSFAPKNFSEMARVLRPGGWLAVSYPGRDHLAELRRRFGGMRQHETAGSRYIEAVRQFVGPPVLHRFRTKMMFDNAAIRAAVMMGPNARHLAHMVLDASHGEIEVTVDLVFLFARKPEGGSPARTS